MSIKTYLKGALGFNGVFDPSFLLVEDIWNYVKKGSVSILISIFCQKNSVSLAINDMVDLCPNLWSNRSKATFFLGATFLDLAFYFDFAKNSCFLCELCVRVTAFSSCLQITPCKTLFEINKYVPNLLT